MDDDVCMDQKNVDGGRMHESQCTEKASRREINHKTKKRNKKENYIKYKEIMQ